jgi:hypothetical protein
MEASMPALTSLEKRLTFTYVGSYDYLDKWETIGEAISYDSFDHITDEGEDYERGTYRLYVKVINKNKNYTEDDIKAALYSTFSKIGCACEYDCCGHRSDSVHKVTNIDNSFYLLKMNWWCNY